MDRLQLLLMVVLIILAIICILVKLTTKPFPNILNFDQEKSFRTSKSGSNLEDFPSLDSPASLKLSVIVPAYNEELRLPKMLNECLEFLEARTSSYEVIIVDDGSKDTTTEVGLDYVEKYGSEKVRVLSLSRNRGKGGAVRMGMLKARGENLLFADADGATTFEDVVKLEEKLADIEEDGHGVVCGSRAHLEEDSIASRTVIRTILMYGFHACVWIFAVKTVKDTQCGFKLIKRRTGQILFKTLHIERWAFDVEMLKIAEMLELPIGEVSVRWVEIDGSKLNPLVDAIKMFRDIALLWLRYAIGAWKLPSKQE
jgi:dolichyl-phosphate beta-glucosyltransferase